MAADDELEVDEVMEEDEGHVRYEIASYPSDLPLSSLAEMWTRKDILIPDFQRSFVWNIKQASLLIESFLIGLPVPQIFFYIDADNRSLVIDGQQRLLSVVFFFEGYFGHENTQGRRVVFRLKGLDPESPYTNKTFADLDEADQRKLRGAVLRAINIRQLNPAGENSSIYHIFERLNTGGTPLKPQEIRNCVFRGDFVKVLRELNVDKNWRKIVGKTTYDKHQKDMELVLRIFSLVGNVDVYEKPMKKYLGDVMSAERDGKSARVSSFQKIFPQVAEIIVKNLGDKPFHVRGPLNTAALDSVFCVLMANLKRIPDDLKQRYAKLKQDKTFQDNTFYSTSDVAVVKSRFELAQRYLIGK